MARLGFFRGGGQFHDGAVETGQRVLEIVVAVDARNLFDEIDLALDVEAPGGDDDRPGDFASHAEAEALQDAGDARGRELLSEVALDLRGTQAQRGALYLPPDGVDLAAFELS